MNFIYLPITIAIYLLAVKLQRRFAFPLFNPVLITLLALVALLLLGNIEFEHYNEFNQYLSYLLQPAVVALGVPLYQQLHAIRRALPQIIAVVVCAVVVAVSSTLMLALMINVSAEVAASLAPKSVTTPIAILISEQINGQPALAAIGVIVTGIVGAVIGVPWMKFTGIDSARAQGVAMGTACHALGTARIAEEGEEHGAYSALAMVLSATFSAILCPFIVPWFIG